MINRFGKRLRELRQSCGLTRKQLAAEAGLSASYIGNLETGIRRPPNEEAIGALEAGLRAHGYNWRTDTGKSLVRLADPMRDLYDIATCLLKQIIERPDTTEKDYRIAADAIYPVFCEHEHWYCPTIVRRLMRQMMNEEAS